MRGKLVRMFGVVAVAAIGSPLIAGTGAEAGTPGPADGYRQDALIRQKGAPGYLGDGFYSDAALPPQNIELVVPRSQTRRFEIRYENDGTKSDRFTISEASFQKGGQWKAKAVKGGKNITGELRQLGGYKTTKLAPGQSGKFELVITNNDGSQNCECLAWQIDVDSRKDGVAIVDSVRVTLENEPL
jgi:hypothetical protein